MKLSYMYAIKRTIHYSAVQWNYSRTALRRMKKSELIDLAQEQRLTIHGTKNDIIDGILASYSSSSSSSPLKPIEKKNTAPLENKSNKVAVKQEYQNENENDEKTTATGDNDDEQFDKQWVEAFDLKVSNRRSSIRSFNKDLSSQKVKPLQQNRPVARIEKTISTPVIFDFNSSQNNEIINKENYNDDNNDNDNDNDNDMAMDDPEINQQWVKAFDQKVKFRASIKPKEVMEIMNSTSSLEKEQKKIKHQEKGKGEEKPIHHQQQQKIMDHSTDNYHSFDAPGKKEQPKSNTIINTMIGSTLLYWYIKGEDGFHNIFSYFTS